MAVVEVKNLVKRFGRTLAVDDISIRVGSGEFVSLLGPSGCGKTTTLRMIAGLIEPDRGDVVIGSETVNNKPIHQRNLGMVFQSYALFPHMTVSDNVGFGLKMRKLSRKETAERVKEALALIQLEDTAERYPRQLSGGQQQRVALARAIVTRPAVLLLDEPLSNLDAKLRDHMRIEIKQLQEKLGVTTIYVTHDQAEALTMSDRVVIINQGRVEQDAPPLEAYESPASAFVADFLGRSNFLSGQVAEPARGCVEVVTGNGLRLLVRTEEPLARGSEVRLAFRPERIQLRRKEGELSLDNRASGEIEFIAFLGAVTQYQILLAQGERFIVERQNVRGIPNFRKGERVFLEWRPEDCLLTGVAAPASAEDGSGGGR